MHRVLARRSYDTELTWQVISFKISVWVNLGILLNIDNFTNF